MKGGIKTCTCETCGLIFRTQVKSEDSSVLCPECRKRRRLLLLTRRILAILIFALAVAGACLAVAYDDILHWTWG